MLSSKGGAPVTSSQVMHPRAYRSGPRPQIGTATPGSARAPCTRASPGIRPSLVASSSSEAAIPKSVSLGPGRRSSGPHSSTLAGFRSRWITFRACACANVSNNESSKARTDDQGSRPMRSSSVPALAYSIATQGTFGATPMRSATFGGTSP